MTTSSPKLSITPLSLPIMAFRNELDAPWSLADRPARWALLRWDNHPAPVASSIPFCAPGHARPERGTLAMVGVGHGDGQGIGGIFGLRVGVWQQHGNHHPNLGLVAMAGAHNGFLNEVGGIFGHGEMSLSRD